MEIKEPEIKIEKNRIKIDTLKLEMPETHHDLTRKPQIKELDLNFKGFPKDTEHFILNLQPLDVFNNIEREFNKVKDFSIAKIDLNRNMPREKVFNLDRAGLNLMN